MDAHSRYILLKIKRNWSRDESCAALLKIISELQTEIGVQKSEIEQLKYELSLKPIPIEPTKTLKKWKKSEAMQMIMQEVWDKDREIIRLNDQVKKYAGIILSKTDY